MGVLYDVKLGMFDGICLVIFKIVNCVCSLFKQEKRTNCKLLYLALFYAHNVNVEYGFPEYSEYALHYM